MDPTIFPRFVPEGTALQSTYEAFRFTESYGVIFQCNVRYCLGPCEPAVCPWGRDNVESWGRRRRHVESVKRNISNEDDEDMNISQEILVLDFGDDDNRLRPTPITSVEDGGAALPARTAAVAPENYRNNSKSSGDQFSGSVRFSTTKTFQSKDRWQHWLILIKFQLRVVTSFVQGFKKRQRTSSTKTIVP